MKLNYQNQSCHGFTLIELLIVIALIVTVLVIATVGFAVIRGNEWFTNDGVLKEIRLTDTNAVEIAAYQRNVFHRSVITVKEEDGRFRKLYLRSNVLFNYSLEPVK